MIILALIVAAGILLSLTILGLYRRHRPRPPVHQVLMAKHLWQPRKLD